MATLTALHEAMTRLDDVWAECDDSRSLSRAQLIAVNGAVDALKRRLDAVHADVAARIAEESRSELGADSLAKQQGYRSSAKLIAASTGMSTGDASRLIMVGEATAPRADLLGAPLPAKYPLVRDALGVGALSVQAAALIVAMLDRCRIVAGRERTAEAERSLTESARGLGLDDVRRLVTKAEGRLDSGGVQRRVDEQRARRSVTIFERDGMVHLDARLDAESAAPVVTAIRGYVTAAFAARADSAGADAPDADRRTVPVLQADALSLFCTHVLGCEERLPLGGATVVVRVALTDLESDAGTAEIDGLDQPVGAGAARRMAAGGGIIPCVLGGDSEILDWGREKRLFTRAQRLALIERDGGCAMCALPPQMTKAHHIRWWGRDRGPTDLENGVLLCETCHHRIHDSGWEIRVEGRGVDGRVWFVPPRWVDPDQTPRLGGRARFDVGRNFATVA
ncbi:DUF222 domain-containing protein [Microbacterium sp. NPDC089696]|uniref:HNH endonuclease signature motif containing protein n=1 Tax=Microbacterium sp. NPDC089696 TaxID=3364199 RepID=UPI00381EBB54